MANISNEIFNQADVVLRSKLFVQKILKELKIENETFNNLNLRLITRTFDSEFLSLIRRNYRKMEVDLEYDWNLKDTKTRINSQLIPIKDTEKCYQFLRNVAEIQIESVHFTGDSNYINSSEKHEQFIKSLVLTNKEAVKRLTSEKEICPATSEGKECIPCRRTASMCQEYGPMAMDALLNAFTTPHHFNTLKITDYLLQHIARLCSNASETKEECLSLMKTYINPLITCDNLNIPFFVMDWNMGDIPHAQPREILNEILNTWKVKNIHMKFIQNEYRNISRSWRRPPKRLFTQFHFMMNPLSIEVSEVSNLFVEHVVVDARWSEMENMYREYWKEPYLHLFSNLIRIFPTSEDIFVIRELKKDNILMFEEVLSNIVKYAWNECPENNQTKLFIRLKYTDFVVHSERDDNIPDIIGNCINGFKLSFASTEINRKFENWRNVLNDYDSNDIRKRFTLKNNSSNRELNFELVHTSSTFSMAKQNVCTPFQIWFYYQLFNE